MSNQIVMCVDSETLQHPQWLGLPDENLHAQGWLSVYCDPFEARQALFTQSEVEEVWVASSNTMEGINLAAAIKRDNRDRLVRLVTFQATGSLMSRSEAAGVVPFQSERDFVTEYMRQKRAFARGSAPSERFIFGSQAPDLHAERGLGRRAESGEGKGSDASEMDVSSGVANARIGVGAANVGVDNGRVKANFDGEPANEGFDVGMAKSNVGADVPQAVGDVRDQREAMVEKHAMAGEAALAERGAWAEKDTMAQRGAMDKTDPIDIEEPSLAQLPTIQPTEPKRERQAAQMVALPKMDLSNAEELTSAGKGEGFSLAVVSGSGGTGKSTIALACAMRCQELGLKTLVFDADLQFGDMAYLLGLDDSLSVMELYRHPQKIAKVVPQEGLPALVRAPNHLEDSETLSLHLAQLVALAKQSFDVVVINTGAFWSEQHAQLLETVDQTLFVLDQRPTSVQGCLRALDLCSRCGIATQPFAYALNFCSRHALLTSLDASCALQGVSVMEVKDGGKEVGELLAASLPKELMASKNPFVQSIHEVCRCLLPQADEKEQAQRKKDPHPQRQGLLSGLLRR